jgi:hypothetical protein
MWPAQDELPARKDVRKEELSKDIDQYHLIVSTAVFILV